ncbi:MAG TPA: protein kinase [Actinomycetota bacterium]|nr:protein kinase [Actinomycetota bacterium]
MVEAQKLIDRYRLEQRLAAGGMGTVYEATDERLNRRVAVKLLKEELVDDPRFVERFRREARAVAGLSHPNIASVFDFGADDGRDFIVMELIEGRDLAELLRSGPLEPSRAAAIAAQSCDALAHAHAAGIVHRDVKPGNIIVSDNDRVKVTDFGIARAIGETTLTATGSVLGTAHYLAPEQASGESVGPAADQYAMGVVLFEMLTGKVPFSGTSPIGIAMRHVYDEIPAPSSIVPEVPATLDETTARATAKDPSERYPDISAMASALRGGSPTGPLAAGAGVAAAGGAATAPLADPSGTRVMRPHSGWSPRRAGRGALAALVILALLVLGLVAGRLLSAPTESSPQDGRPRDRKQGQAAAKPSPTPSPSDTATPFALPNVVGLDYESADQILSDAGLVPERVDDPEAEGAPEEVVDTNPDPRVEVSPGDSIEVVVAVPGPPEENPGTGNGNGKGKGKKNHNNGDEGGD